MKKLSIWIALATVGMLAACGGGGDNGGTGGDGGTTPPADCSPSGTELQVSASDTRFLTDCLAAPADTAFTIEFEITDGTTHNVVIENGEKLFDGEIFTGPDSMTYQVGAIPAGVYTFYCKVHPGPMQGTFVVE